MDPEKEYAVKDFDTNLVTRKRGRELMEQGCTVEITTKRGSALLEYTVVQ